MATEALRARESRVLTIPNLVTFLRLGSIPVFEWLLLRHDRQGWWPAALLLAAIGITDFVDGFLARRLDQVSTLGKVLDPIADRLVLAVAGISVLAVGGMPIWVGVVALVREMVVNVGGLIAALAGGRRIDVSRWGKAGTFGLLVAFPLFLAGHSTVGGAQGFEDAAWVFAIPGLVLGWVALGTYVPVARRAVLEGRAAREHPPTDHTPTELAPTEQPIEHNPIEHPTAQQGQSQNVPPSTNIPPAGRNPQ